MKTLSTTPAHKLIFWICFLPCSIFILTYELYLTNIPSYTNDIYKLGIISSKICYSIIAASIFYFIAQYIPVYLPKERRKIFLLHYLHQQILLIDYNVATLKSRLGIQSEDYKQSQDFRKVLKGIKSDEPIEEFANWHQYLFHLKIDVLDIIRSLYFYHEYLSIECLHELVIIEKQLMSPIVFSGKKTLAIENLYYAEINLQEILIHNQHLQMAREEEENKYKKKLKAEGKKYREKYYKDTDKK